MIKPLHKAGIEVILDVIYNHTAEGDDRGPTLCFRGLENTAYYILESDRSRYANFSGTGNTLNANHPVVRRMDSPQDIVAWRRPSSGAVCTGPARGLSWCCTPG